MKKIVERERNQTYYRLLHLPNWIWVFWILPGHLTYALFSRGPDGRHWWWLGAVTSVCAWRGFLGRLPGVEPRPYVTHYGAEQPNLAYRVVCYTAAWIDLLVPFSLNLLGVVWASLTGEWLMRQLYLWLYYPLALAVVCATLLDWTPRARRSIRNEGGERAWFYVAIWTVVPAQLVGWAAWRLGGQWGLAGLELARARLGAFALVTALFLALGLKGRLPRTERYHVSEELRESAGEVAD